MRGGLVISEAVVVSSGFADETAVHDRYSTSCFDAVHGRWMVLWTKSRQEKAVARYLNARGLDWYLPLVNRTTLCRGRKLLASVPLFPGYVFVAGEKEDGYGAISTRRVCQVIEVADQDRFIQELQQIHRAVEEGGELELYPFAVVGRRCRVTKGPFIGMEGMVTDRLGPSRLMLLIDVLSLGASLEIDADFLEPID